MKHLFKKMSNVEAMDKKDTFLQVGTLTRGNTA
jgi:hypothetical protein